LEGITSLTIVNEEALICCGKDGRFSIYELEDFRLLS